MLGLALFSRGNYLPSGSANALVLSNHFAPASAAHLRKRLHRLCKLKSSKADRIGSDKSATPEGAWRAYARCRPHPDAASRHGTTAA